MRDRVKARSGTGVAGHEYQLAILHSSLRPLEITLRMHGLIVLVGAHQGHVYIETRKVKVVRITAEKRRLKFRHEDQTHVRIFLVAIEIVLPTLVKGDDIRTKTGRFS